MRKFSLVLLAAALLLVGGNVWADQVVEKTMHHPVEFSDTLDDAAIPGGLNGPDPGQVLFTIVRDLLDGAHPSDSWIDYDDEVDALANVGDAYFHGVVNNTANLLVSFNADPGVNAVWFETPAPVRGLMWSHQDMSFTTTGGPGPDPNFDDLDGLETYGPGTLDDANRASFNGDAVAAVFEIGPPVAPVVTNAQILTAVGALGYTGPTPDVDALMMSGDEMIFSIRASGNWDGGELVYVGPGGPATAVFLFHGGHLWNTAFDVGTAFGVGTEEVDAIEAWGGAVPMTTIPSLTTYGLIVLLALLLLSGIIVIRRRRATATA